MWRILFGKYKEIIAAVAVFVVLDAGVLLLNFYTTYQISDDAHAIRLASRQAALTQRIFYSVTQVREDLIHNRNFEKHQANLAVSYKQFDEAFDAFIYGGTLIGQGQGQNDLLMGDTYKEFSDKYLLEAEKLWKPYRQLVGPLVYAEYYDDDIDAFQLVKKADAAIAYARDHGDKLLELVTEFALAVENKAQSQAGYLRLVQAIAITFAVINFFIILFHFIKRLNNSDEQIKSSQEETAQILKTVNDGLFLLNAEYKIGSQYSSSMESLFHQHEFFGKHFLQLLAPLVSGDTLNTAKDYIDSLFNRRVKSYLMNELNPLQEVEITVNSKHGESNHFFSFEFTRVYQGGNIIHLLVSVKDVTDNIKLQHKLKVSEEKVSQSLGRQVKVDFSQFNEHLIPSESMPVIKNILIQLIRNAIVHGLEKPEKRRELGKNPVGRIAVIVEKSDDMLVIKVSDDGRGIDFKAIKKYLLQQGFCTQEKVEAMSPKELVKYIFKPGFSTAKYVDNHAGRGVGLDVVKELLDEMGAYLSVSCKAKKSSEFRIRIPVKQNIAQSA